MAAAERSDMPKLLQVGIRLAIVGIALVVQSCREDDEQRPLIYHKGTYQGQQDQRLTDQQVDALRQRSTRQQY
jgi:hypothetical protein